MTIIKLQNLSTLHTQDTWVSMGIPHMDGFDYKEMTIKDGRTFKVIYSGEELFVRGKLAPNETLELDVDGSGQDFVPEFQFSEWVIDEIQKLIPQFVLDQENGSSFTSEPMQFWAGGPKPDHFIELESDGHVRKRFHFRTQIKDAPMTIEGWIDLFDKQEVTPITIRCSFGTVASDKIVNRRFGSLRMLTGEKVVIDFRKPKGLREPIYVNGLWDTEIASPRLWWKARTVEVFGALLCMPPYEKMGEYFGLPGFIEKVTTLMAREEAPVVGICTDWYGNWMACNTVPEAPENMAQAITSSKNAFYTRIQTFGDEYDQRAYAQPKNSAQTGNQPDFGVARGELVVTAHQPWALFDYRFSVQAWMLRPYSHKEANGDPVKAVNHPNTKLYNLSIDTRFGSDFLGFPNPIPYSEFWTGSDSQHRSDNLLYAMYALTRDPSIKATIDDLAQCSLMELKTYQHFGMPTSIEAPRGWGRPLLAMAQACSLGFNDLRPNMIEMANVMHDCAAMHKIVQDGKHTVRTLSNNGSKYGWVDASGRPIRAWVCWEEAIGAIGLWAAFMVTGDDKYRKIAFEIARTIVRHAFFKTSDGKWYTCYAVRWNTDDPGMPLPASSYRLTARPEDNKDVFVYGMQQWMLPCVEMIIMYDDEAQFDMDLLTKAKDIRNYFGNPKTFDDSAWLAI